MKFHLRVEGGGVKVSHQANKLVERWEGVTSKTTDGLIREKDLEGGHVEGSTNSLSSEAKESGKRNFQSPSLFDINTTNTHNTRNSLVNQLKKFTCADECHHN